MSLFVLLGKKARTGPEAKLIRAALKECARRGGFARDFARPEILGALDEIRKLPDGAIAWILASPGEIQDVRAHINENEKELKRANGFLIHPLSEFWARPIEEIPGPETIFENHLLFRERRVWEKGGVPPKRQAAPGVIELPIDPLALFASILYRAEEDRESAELDTHGRYAHQQSMLFRAGLMDRPIADEIAIWIGLVLAALKNGAGTGANGAEAKSALEGAALPRRPWRLAVTHDVDALAYWTLRRAVRERSAQAVLGAVASIPSPESDPYWTFPRLRAFEREKGVRPTVFVLPERRTRDELYDFRNISNPKSKESRFREELLHWVEEGAEIGLHAPYDSIDQPGRLEAQRAILENALPGAKIRSCRRHWLRMRVPEIWNALEAAGIESDSTLGYSGIEGFRAGTCHPFQAFCLKTMQPKNLVEIPLIAMDATLKHHRKFPPAEALDRLRKLCDSCRGAGGAFTLLWHTHAWRTPDWTGWEVVFEGVIEEALSSGAQSATISEIARDYPRGVSE